MEVRGRGLGGEKGHARQVGVPVFGRQAAEGTGAGRLGCAPRHGVQLVHPRAPGGHQARRQQLYDRDGGYEVQARAQARRQDDLERERPRAAEAVGPDPPRDDRRARATVRGTCCPAKTAASEGEIAAQGLASSGPARTATSARNEASRPPFGDGVAISYSPATIWLTESTDWLHTPGHGPAAPVQCSRRLRA